MRFLVDRLGNTLDTKAAQQILSIDIPSFPICKAGEIEVIEQPYHASIYKK